MRTCAARGCTGCSTFGWVQPTQMEGLRVLPSGELPPNSAEIVGSQHMQKLLHELAQQVDVVLIDSLPVLPVADAALLAPTVDGVLLVLKAGKTRSQFCLSTSSCQHGPGGCSGLYGDWLKCPIVYPKRT